MGLKRGFLAVFGGAVVVLTLAALAMAVGEYPVPLSKVVCFILGMCRDAGSIGEVLRIRFARVAASILVGMGLSASGAALQAVLGNPLASPFTLGVSQAAGFGAAAAIILLGAGYSAATATPVATMPYLVSTAAFVAAMTAVLSVYMLSTRRGLAPSAVILAGVAVGFMFQALTMLVEYLAPNEVLVSAALFWMFGDVSRATLFEDLLIAAVVLPVYVLFSIWWMEFDALLLGDDVAASIGVEPRRVRAVTLLAAALATAVSVAFVGVIGFVGLLGPHIARLLTGSGSHRLVMPIAGLVGAALLLAADTLGRTLLYPNTLPVGVTTSLIGAPLLTLLISKLGILGDGDGGSVW